MIEPELRVLYRHFVELLLEKNVFLSDVGKDQVNFCFVLWIMKNRFDQLFRR